MSRVSAVSRLNGLIPPGLTVANAAASVLNAARSFGGPSAPPSLSSAFDHTFNSGLLSTGTPQSEPFHLTISVSASNWSAAVSPVTISSTGSR